MSKTPPIWLAIIIGYTIGALGAIAGLPLWLVMLILVAVALVVLRIY